MIQDNNDHPAARAAPVFVLCGSRSGSTLLRYVLDTHPQVCCPAELHLCSLMQQLMWVHAHTIDRRPAGTNQDTVRIEAEARTRQDIQRIMTRYAGERGKQVWCEKSVFTADMIELVSAIFPQARHLCLYRDPMDFLASAMEAMQKNPSAGQGYGFASFLAQTPGQPLNGLLDYWLDKTGRILAFETANPGRSCRVRYEDLVRETSTTLDTLFGFLGLAWDRRLIDAVFETPHEQGPGDNKILETNKISDQSIGRGKDIASGNISPDRHQRMNNLLERLGYAPGQG